VDLALVERLICPRPHQATPLVVRADEVVEGNLVRGVVGCPQCFAEWTVRGGVVEFGAIAEMFRCSPQMLRQSPALLGLAEAGRLVLTDGASA